MAHKINSITEEKDVLIEKLDRIKKTLKQTEQSST